MNQVAFLCALPGLFLYNLPLKSLIKKLAPWADPSGNFTLKQLLFPAKILWLHLCDRAE